MRKWVIPLALMLGLSPVHAQTWTKLNFGIDRTATPFNIGIDVGTSVTDFKTIGTISSAGAFKIDGASSVYTSDAANPVTTTVQAQLRKRVYAEDDSRVDKTGVSDSAAGINSQLSLHPGEDVWLEPGRYLINDAITIPTGTSLMCDGRTTTTLVVNHATFNMNAMGVIIFAQNSDSAMISGCQIEFDQNQSATTRADLYKYPPAIYGFDATRPIVERVRVSGGAWRCLSFIGNEGGAEVDNFECSGLSSYAFAQYTASASAGVLTVSAVASGTIATGDYGYAVSGNTYTPYKITGQLTGVAGSTGTYSISSSSTTFGSRTNYQTIASILVDGPRDFVHFTHVNCWPYGMTLASSYYTAIYQDGTNNCAAIGRSDGFASTVMQTFGGSVVSTPTANAGGITHQYSKLDLDGDGARFLSYGGRTQIALAYSTKTNAVSSPTIYAAGGTTRILDFDAFGDTSTGTVVQVTSGASLSIMGGYSGHGTVTTPFASVDGSGSRLVIANMTHSVPRSNRSSAYFTQTGATASLSLINNRTLLGPGAATGNIVSYANDNALNRVEGNEFNGWPHDLSAFNTSLGFYSFAEPDTCTVTPTFATPGDLSLSATTGTTCTYYRRGNDVLLRVYSIFTPTFTTASGVFSLALTNFPTPADSNNALAIANISKVTTSGIALFASMTSAGVFFNQWTSGSAATQLTNANFVSATADYQFRLSGTYRVR